MPWSDIKYFKPDEFSSPDDPGTGIRMNMDLVERLDALRAKCNFALIITSGYRTDAHNKKVGGVDSSEHTDGNAVDIRCKSSSRRFTIVENALLLGFERIGIGSTFVHLGVSKTHPQRVIWTY